MASAIRWLITAAITMDFCSWVATTLRGFDTLHSTATCLDLKCRVAGAVQCAPCQNRPMLQTFSNMQFCVLWSMAPVGQASPAFGGQQSTFKELLEAELHPLKSKSMKLSKSWLYGYGFGFSRWFLAIMQNRFQRLACWKCGEQPRIHLTLGFDF